MSTTTQTSLIERRRTIGNVLAEISSQRGPLNEAQRQALRELSREADQIEDQVQTEARKNYASAFRSWIRYGLEPGQFNRGVSAEARSILEVENRDLGTAGLAAYPGSTSGFFVPIELWRKVEIAMKSYSSLLAVSTPLDTLNGAPLEYPTALDTGTVGQIIPEHGQFNTADPTLALIKFTSYKFNSRAVVVSNEFLKDSGIDLDSFFATIFGYRLARIQNLAFTAGTAGGPSGLVSAVTSTYAAVGNASDDGGGGSTSTVGGADLANVELLLDSVYRSGAKWMCHPNTLAALRRQRNKQGSFLHQGLHSGGVDTLLNYELITNPDLPQLQTEASSPPTTVTSMLFGRFDKFVWRRMTPVLYRLRERFGEFDKTAFTMNQRSDGQLLDAGTHPIVGLTNTF